jgi:hypothetical protein
MIGGWGTSEQPLTYRVLEVLGTQYRSDAPGKLVSEYRSESAVNDEARLTTNREAGFSVSDLRVENPRNFRELVTGIGYLLRQS